MIGTRPKPTKTPAIYRVPTLDELLQICADFNLIENIREVDGRMKIKCKADFFDVTVREAEILARGLLLGYFAHQTRDDLGLSSWAK